MTTESSWLSPGEFTARLQAGAVGQLVNEHILDGLPFAFRDKPDLLSQLQGHLESELGVTGEHVRVIGSARTGFSLSPWNYARPFGEQSDIDVAVYDESLFDDVWITMLKWNYPRRWPDSLPKADAAWRRKRTRELYWGWFRPHEIGFRGLSLPAALKPLRDLSTKWFNAFQALSLYPDLAGHPVSGRLYRTRDMAFLYHYYGLLDLDRTLQKASQS